MSTSHSRSVRIPLHYVCKIYVLIHPVTLKVRYVGWTKNSLRKRLNGHRDELTSWRRTGKGKTRKNMWLWHLKKNGLWPIIRRVETVPRGTDPGERERYWIAKYKAEGASLVNGTEGGRGCLGAKWKLTDAQREAIRNRPKREVTERERKALSKRAKGNKNWLGKHHSEETKAKFKKIQNTPEAREKRREMARKRWARWKAEAAAKGMRITSGGKMVKRVRVLTTFF